MFPMLQLSDWLSHVSNAAISDWLSLDCKKVNVCMVTCIVLQRWHLAY
uniref:Uncharacterized protein n=1 Tax=Anguilla anguilla TaxID=7936 RepID=A0A0E9SQW9_ANGAN